MNQNKPVLEWRNCFVLIVGKKHHIGKDQILELGIVKIVWGIEKNDL